MVFTTQLVEQILRNLTNIVPDFLQGLLERTQLPPPVLDDFAWHGIHVGHWRDHYCLANTDSRGTGDTTDLRRRSGTAAGKFRANGARDPCVGNNPGQLG